MENFNAASIIYGQHCVPEWEWRVEPGGHSGLTFWSAWGGRGVMRIGSREYEIRGGDCFLIDYRDKVHGIQDSDSPLRVRYVDFDIKKGGAPSGWPEHRRLDDGRFIGELLDRVQTAFRQDDQAATALWFKALMREYRDCAPPREHHPYSAKIDLICQRFQDCPEAHYDIREIAREHSYDVDHFIRIFKAAKGLTPYAFLVRIRLETAMVLLRNSDNSIGQIAVGVGFEDIYSFSRFFRQKTGFTPSEFRSRR